MANKNINIFEQHVEKFTVGVVALVFLWTIYGYLLSSPNKLSLDGRTVTPAGVDKQVQAKAETLLSRLRNTATEPAEVTDYPQELLARSKGPLHRDGLKLASHLVASVSPGPPVPDVQGPLSAGHVTLATLAPPDKPTVATGRLTGLFPPYSVAIGEELPDAEQEVLLLEGARDKSWVTLAIRFNYSKQTAVLLENNYQTNRFGLTVSDIFLRRQMRLPNGEWGSWEEVDEYSQYHMDPEPELTVLIDQDERPYVPEQQRSALQIWFGNLQEFQSDLVRAPMPAPAFGDPWRPPFLEDLIDMYPEEVYPEVILVRQDAKKLSPIKRAKQDLIEARQRFEDGKLGTAEAQAEAILRAKNLPKKLRDEARLLLEEIDAAITQKDIELARRGGNDEDDEGEQADREYDIFFAHDLTAEPGATYRYQLKVQAFNQYATIADRLKNPQQATQVYVESEWSPTTDPVVIPSQQRVYLASAKSDSAQFDIYQWVQGSWVREKFNTKVGEEIGGSKRVVVDGSRSKVEFTTGLRLLDLNLAKPYVPHKRQRDGSVVLGEPETSLAAICQRSDGEVVEFLRAEAANDPDRKLIEEEMKDAKRRKKSGRRTQTGRPGRPAGDRGRGGG